MVQNPSDVYEPASQKAQRRRETARGTLDKLADTDPQIFITDFGKEDVEYGITESLRALPQDEARRYARRLRDSGHDVPTEYLQD